MSILNDKIIILGAYKIQYGFAIDYRAKNSMKLPKINRVDPGDFFIF